MDLQKTTTGSEPITATEVKNYLKIDFSTDDDLIDDLITGTREMAEEMTGLSLIASTIVYTVPLDYDEEIWLPFPDHDSVTALTINGDDELSDSIISGNYEKVIKLPYTYNELQDDDDGVVITYTTKGNCPTGVKLALLKNIAELYEKRGNTFEGSIAELTENTISLLTKFMRL